MVGPSAAEACAEREAERKRKEKKRQKEMLIEPSNEAAPTPGQYSCLGLAIRMASGLLVTLNSQQPRSLRRSTTWDAS